MQEKSQKPPTVMVASVATLLLGPMLTLELLLPINNSGTSLTATSVLALFVSWFFCKLMWRAERLTLPATPSSQEREHDLNEHCGNPNTAENVLRQGAQLKER
jgi:hypothetical protein